MIYIPVRNRRSHSARQLSLFAVGCTAFAVAMGELAWLVARHRLGLTAKDAFPSALTAAGLALTLAIALGVRAFDYLAQRRSAPLGPLRGPFGVRLFDFLQSFH